MPSTQMKIQNDKDRLLNAPIGEAEGLHRDREQERRRKSPEGPVPFEMEWLVGTLSDAATVSATRGNGCNICDDVKLDWAFFASWNSGKLR